MRLALCGLGKAGINFVEFVNHDDADELCAVLCRDESSSANKKVVELTNISTPNDLCVQKISEFDNKEKIDVLVDFSSGETSIKLVDICCKYGINLVICPTNITNEQLIDIEKKAVESNIGIVFAPTLTEGINVLINFVKEFSKQHPEFSFEIVEKHGKNKPKPTRTSQIIVNEINREDVSISSIRLNGFVGVHEVIASNGFERITFEHESLSRDAFSNGAMRAARFILGKVGLYNIKDV